MPAILETAGLTKTFGAVTAAASISVAVGEDTVVGLIGGNGAGKTTFVNLVTGYLTPTAGTVRFAGDDITGLSPRRITRMGICRSFQIPQVFESLTARDNLLVGLGIVSLSRRAFAAPTAVSGRTPEDAADEMLARFHLEKWTDARASVLPEGVRKLLDIAMALAVKPRILLLDEPTSGVSADEKFALMDLVLGAVRADRVTVLFVEHDMEIIRRYTHRVLAFYEGRIIADGAPADVFDHAEVKRYVVGGAVAAPVREGSC
ncbi:MAG TPA: ABC transporter ATP-binding protein [Myxococcales bacterium]|jgi:branched-chain amino acid transport system ATP-binding protein|nr:ABC transporter ATP-binding protein [Myxococcales bacterium]